MKIEHEWLYGKLCIQIKPDNELERVQLVAVEKETGNLTKSFSNIILSLYDLININKEPLTPEMELAVEMVNKSKSINMVSGKEIKPPKGEYIPQFKSKIFKKVMSKIDLSKLPPNTMTPKEIDKEMGGMKEYIDELKSLIDSNCGPEEWNIFRVSLHKYIKDISSEKAIDQNNME